MTTDEKKLFFDTVARFEGFRSRPYRCPAGLFTIGYGHTQGVKPNSKVTQFEARNLLVSDFDQIFAMLNSHNFNIQEHELFAIADFIFNLGIGNFLRSSLYSLLSSYSSARNQNSSEEFLTICKSRICKKINEFVYYTDTKGVKKKSSNLVNRRCFEAHLFKFGKISQL